MWKETDDQQQLISNVFSEERLSAIAYEVKLIELIHADPNQTTKYYAQQIGRAPHWVLETLNKYRKDGTVKRVIDPTRRHGYLWSLKEAIAGESSQ